MAVVSHLVFSILLWGSIFAVAGVFLYELFIFIDRPIGRR